MASRPLRPGDPRRLGDYQLLARLGEGGMGTVFLGRDPAGRPVAVKAIRREYADQEEFRARFRSEVNRVRQVPSFCTAAVLDADPDHQTPYLVVEYVDGPSLQDVVTEQGPLPEGDLHSVALGVGAALTAIHGAGVIHRDLKPTNVLLSLGLPKVIDFGLAQALEVTSRHTRTDYVVGTVAYLAPERLDPTLGPVTPAADIFAWGAVVAYAGTGRTPFGGDTPMATAARILTMPPDVSGLPGPMAELVARALAKNWPDRPTASEVVQHLLTASTPVVRATARPVAGPVGRPVPDGRPAEDQPAHGRFDARELLEQLIAEGPKRPAPAPAPPARVPAPRSPRPARHTTGPERRLAGPGRRLRYGLLALAGVVGATATYAWAAADQPAAPPPAAPAAASANPLDARGPSLFDPLDAPRRVPASSGDAGSCGYADGRLRARTTGTSTYMCPAPPDVFAGDQSITVDVTLAVPGSCAMVWFRYDRGRGYQVAACDDRMKVDRLGGAIVTSIGKAQPTALRPGTRHRLSVTIAGQHATVAIDGVTAIQAAVADADRASGQVVLGISGTGAKGPAEVRFADLEVRAS